MVIQNPYTGENQNSLHKTLRPFEPPDDIVLQNYNCV